jgi:uncharacterized protein YlxP (DUF503 family)
MIDRSIKGTILVFSVFFLGIVSGVLLTDLWDTMVDSAVISSNHKSAERELSKFYDYVGLSEVQLSQVSQIMKDSRPAFKKVFEQTRPLLEAMQKETRAQIRAILTEHQRKKYDEFNQTINARRNNQRPQHSN